MLGFNDGEGRVDSGDGMDGMVSGWHGKCPWRSPAPAREVGYKYVLYQGYQLLRIATLSARKIEGPSLNMFSRVIIYRPSTYSVKKSFTV